MAVRRPDIKPGMLVVLNGKPVARVLSVDIHGNICTAPLPKPPKVRNYYSPREFAETGYTVEIDPQYAS